MGKYEFTGETKAFFGITLHRICALKDFGGVKSGELGGWIEKESNLKQDGDAQVYGDAWVGGDAWVYGDAQVCGDAWVYGDAQVCGDARVCGDAQVCGDARVYGNARVCGDARVYGNARVCGDAQVCGDARVYGNARVCGDAYIFSTTSYLTIGPIGSRDGTTTFFNTTDGTIWVSCGCFLGSIDEFEAAVKKTHGKSKFAKSYKAAIELARITVETKELVEEK